MAVCSPEFRILARIAPLTLEFMQKAHLKLKMGTLYGCCAAMLFSPEVRAVPDFIRNPLMSRWWVVMKYYGQAVVGMEK
eukprot:scaffold168627_cov82-Attheya_sp.AAC.1